MAYNSAHTGPEIDAAVQLLGDIQSAKDATAADRQAVSGMAVTVATQAGQVSSQAASVSSNTAIVLASASAVEADRAEVEQNKDLALSAKNSAEDAEVVAVSAKEAVEAIQSAVNQSQVEVNLSEQNAGDSASAARADREIVEALAQQVGQDSASAAASAASAAEVVTGGTATLFPEPGKIPLAKGDGRIDSEWLPEDIARSSAVVVVSEKADSAASAAEAAEARTAGFLAPAAEPPALRDNGLPLQLGDRYFSTADQAEFIYGSEGWEANDSQQAIADLKNQTDPDKGAAQLGWDGAPVSDQLALSKKLANYSALRNYSGLASRVEITQSTLAGPFIKRPFAQGDVDNGGTRILSANGLWTWERVFQGSVMSTWFQVVPGDSSNRYTTQLQSAINYTSASFNGTLEVVGDVYLDAMISVPSTSKYNLDFTRARLIYDSSVTVGMTFGTPGVNPYRGTVAGLRMTKSSRGTGDIGFKLVNVAESDFIACGSENFSKAFTLVPSANSRVAYNKFHDPVVSNHEYGLWAKPEDAGSYVNGNTVDGGRFGSFVAGRLIDHVYLDNELGSGVQHNKFDKLSIEGFSGSGACGRAAVRCVNGANQNVVEWCRTEKYNDGWSDATYFFGEGTFGNTVLDTRSDLTIVDNGSNNWWTPITGFHFNGFQSNQAAMPAFKYTRSAPLSSVATKYAIDIADTYAASGEVGLLKYTSARGGGTLIDIATSLGSMRMNGACEWTTPSRRSGAVSGASSHGYSVAASVTGATLCAAYHSLKSNEAGNWFLYGEGNAPSYFGGPIRTVGTNNITPATAYTGALWFSNTSSNTGGVASEYQTNNVATRHHVAFSNPNGVVGSISTSASATSYNTSSDERMKQNIQDSGDSGPDIDAIRVAQFDWKAGGDHQDYGFIAQELVHVAPYAVSHDPDDPEASWGVDYSKLVPMMMREIQMLRERVRLLEE